jgi:polyketide synthase PksN
MVEYVVSTQEENSRRVVHSQGKLVFESHHERRAAYPRLDLDSIGKRCLKRRSKAECYQMFKARGLDYGPSFQVIKELWHNEDEVLSYLELPPDLKEGLREYLLHPALMDAALQTVIGLKKDEEQESHILHVPFALGELEIMAPLPHLCYAYAVKADDQHADKRKVRKFSIQLVDERGQLILKMKNFSIKALKKQSLKSESSGIGPNGVEPEVTTRMYYQGGWERSDLDFDIARNRTPGHILIFDINEAIAEAVKERLAKRNDDMAQVILVKPGKDYHALGNLRYEINSGRKSDYQQVIEDLQNRNLMPARIIHVWSQGSFNSSREAIEPQLEQGVYSVFYLSQALIEQKPKTQVQIIYAYSDSKHDPQPLYAATSGLAKCISLESPKLFYKTIEIQGLSGTPSNLAISQIVDLLLAEFQADADKGIEIRYEGERRFIKRLKEFEPEGIQ